MSCPTRCRLVGARLCDMYTRTRVMMFAEALHCGCRICATSGRDEH